MSKLYKSAVIAGFALIPNVASVAHGSPEAGTTEGRDQRMHVADNDEEGENDLVVSMHFISESAKKNKPAANASPPENQKSDTKQNALQGWLMAAFAVAFAGGTFLHLSRAMSRQNKSAPPPRPPGGYDR